jgi:peptide/nickel transport system ATP-binding protein
VSSLWRRKSLNNIAIEARSLVKHFEIKQGFFKSLMTKEAPVVHAVDGVSFQIRRGEIFGLVGESGCGKTTTGRLLVRLIEPTNGEVLFQDTDITAATEKDLRKLRRKIQIIFQDPYESLDPRMSIYDIIAEPIRIQKAAKNETEIGEKVRNALEEFDLVPAEEYMYRFPHELSGGQRQRVSVARAFILNPEFLVADEPVSMLDASIRSEVLKLLLAMQKKLQTSFLYITHDIALARHMCDRIAVMYLGKIVEQGPTEDVVHKPLHPYTQALIAAVPVPDPTARRIRVTIKGEVPSAIAPPPGCRFNTRCPHAMEICRSREPPLAEVAEHRRVACFLHTKA